MESRRVDARGTMHHREISAQPVRNVIGQMRRNAGHVRQAAQVFSKPARVSTVVARLGPVDEGDDG